ncbi:MAG: 4-hydroxy-tetrahydrodipicolinate reductase [SAR202 cluster bacterium]|nr:4-hydroxy-tetrahydrodipicolinate reductase [SAR202 cluster bacterium]
MPPIKVVVQGATGKMGMETVSAVCRQDDLALVGATCLRERGATLALPGGGEVPLSTNLQEMLERTRPDVMVEFTNAAACMASVSVAAAYSVNMVLGASGLTPEHLRQLDALAHDKNVGIVVAPNFALGAVVLKKLVEQAAPYFDYVDIIEAHHEAKIDAPSGFAMAMARSIGDRKEFTRNHTEKENLPGTRGGEYHGVTVHSIRMPGRSAHHEVIMGAAGQTISLRHDTLGRDCYMPGVLCCIREVVKRPGLVVGLENVLGL